jgi:accessory colonization factor AcfC
MAKKVKVVKKVEKVIEPKTIDKVVNDVIKEKIKCVVTEGSGVYFGTDSITDGTVLNLPSTTLKGLLAKGYVSLK